MSLRNAGTKAAVAVIVVVMALTMGACKGSSSNHSAASPAGASSGASAGGSGGDAAFSCPEKNTKSFAKTKFVAHAGLGFGAFRHWIYKPMKAGKFSKGQKGRILTFAKAGAAALFVKREVRLAAEDAQASPALCKAIVKPLKDLSDKVQGAISSAKKGDLSGVNQANSDADNVMSLSKKQGDTITPNENADISKVPA